MDVASLDVVEDSGEATFRCYASATGYHVAGARIAA